MAYSREREIAKHGEIIKAEFDIFALKTQGVNGTTKAQRERGPGRNDIQTKLIARSNEDNIFLKTGKMTGTYGERVADRLEVDRELKIRKDAAVMVYNGTT